MFDHYKQMTFSMDIFLRDFVVKFIGIVQEEWSDTQRFKFS